MFLGNKSHLIKLYVLLLKYLSTEPWHCRNFYLCSLHEDTAAVVFWTFATFLVSKHLLSIDLKFHFPMCAKKFLTMLFGNTQWKKQMKPIIIFSSYLLNGWQITTFLQFLLTNFGPKVANFLCLYGTKSTIDFA